eukprot:6010715-Heterocapsa_arctica.AAC.1
MLDTHMIVKPTTKTLERIRKFADPEEQTEGQSWMAEGLIMPLRNVAAEYTSFPTHSGNAYKYFQPPDATIAG